MKIKFNKNYDYAFDGINITRFKEGHIYENISDDFCKLMIERGYAVDAKPKEIIIENKRAEIEDKKETFTEPKRDIGLVTKKKVQKNAVEPPLQKKRGRPSKKGKQKK